MGKKGSLFANLKYVVAVFLILFLVGQLYSTLINPFSTETVYSEDNYIGIEINGLVIRNETVLTDSTKGVKSYSVGNGEKVAKNGIIANIYSSQMEVENIAKLKNLNERIKKLEEISGYNDIKAANIDLIDSKIKDYYIEYLEKSQTGIIDEDCKEAGEGFLEYTNRRQIAVGTISDFSELIAGLKAEATTLQSQIGQPIGKISSSESGYYLHSVDGYENVVNIKELSELNVEKFKEIKPNKETQENEIGKIVLDFQWYIVAEVPFNDALKLKTENNVKIKTGIASAPEISATIKYINKQSVGETALVVLECKQMNSDFADLRHLDCTIVLEEYKGLKVSNTAIRMVENQRGVYVLSTGQAKFVPVDIIYSNDSYSICKMNYGEDRSLRLYDEVIVKGKNLYDGKAVQ